MGAFSILFIWYRLRPTKWRGSLHRWTTGVSLLGQWLRNKWRWRRRPEHWDAHPSSPSQQGRVHTVRGGTCGPGPGGYAEAGWRRNHSSSNSGNAGAPGGGCSACAGPGPGRGIGQRGGGLWVVGPIRAGTAGRRVGAGPLEPCRNV